MHFLKFPTLQAKSNEIYTESCTRINIVVMFTLSFLGILLCFARVATVEGQVAAHAFNLTTDPLPPIQPSECGYQSHSVANYTFIDTSNHEQASLVDYWGFILSSYSHLTTMAVTAGINKGVPQMTQSYSNFNDISNPKSLMQAQYASTQCNYFLSEGGQGFQGYDFYRNYLQTLVGKIPITYEEADYKDFGLCMMYTLSLPGPQLPAFQRDMEYNIIFQKSTGYLVTYINQGTEYCCAEADGGSYCVSSELTCKDGSIPRLTYAISGSYYDNYQIYSANAFANSPILGSYCPFDQCPVAPAATPAKVVTESTTAIVLGTFMCIMLILCIYLYRQLQVQITLNKGTGTATAETATAGTAATSTSLQENPMHSQGGSENKNESLNQL